MANEEAVWKLDLPTFLHLHERAFRDLGGLVRVIRHDNMTAGVSRACRYVNHATSFAVVCVCCSPSAKGACHDHDTTVPRDWATLERLRIPSHKTLPDVLTFDEVRQLVDAVRTLHNRTYFWTVYSLGLRLTEALHLQAGDIDSARMLVHIHRGKGAKDRFVPLPHRTLELLRAYWATHRNPLWLFLPPDAIGTPQPPPPSPWRAGHRNVMSAIAACRTGELGTVVYSCARCARRHSIGRSCGTRHCPTCQQHKPKHGSRSKWHSCCPVPTSC